MTPGQPEHLRERLDLLVQRIAEVTRSKAQGLIQTGRVRDAEGRVMDKPGARVAQDTILVIDGGPRYVSRGGEKLHAALEAFPICVEGRIAADIGASTGGFSDCLLQHGVAKVYAIDVGYGQLAWKLRQDPRVVVMERVNARHLEPGDFQEPPDLFVADCSFISLRLILPPLRPLLAVSAEGIVLIKPQFEAGREHVGRGGVVRDEEVREAVVRDVLEAANAAGYSSAGVIPSPLLGPAGNREYLAYLKLGRDDMSGQSSAGNC